MKAYLLILLLIACCLGCKFESAENADADKHKHPFNQQQWLTKEDDDYPFREKMFHTLVYNDTIRSLNKEEIIDLLGPADRFENNHYYYLIAQTRLKNWPLHTTSMVVKFTEADSIEWIKIHE